MNPSVIIIESSTPNQKIFLTSEDTLNKLSEAFRECYFQKNRKLKEGFEINPFDLSWEYIIAFGDSTIVFKEFENSIFYWAYLDGENDIIYYKHSSFNRGVSFSEKKRFCELIISLVLTMELEKGKK